MANENLQQVYSNNPVSSLINTDLFYVIRSPYGSTNDAGVSWLSMQQSITSLSYLTGSIQAPTFIGDSAGNKTLSFSYQSTPNNYVQVANAAIGVTPSLQAIGDTNIGLKLLGNGTAGVLAGAPSGTTPFTLVPNSGTNSFGVQFSVPTITASRTITFPDASGTVSLFGNAPNASSVLASNSSAVATWLPSLTNGQVVIGSTGATPAAATITGNGGLVVTNGAGTINISAPSLSALTGSLQAPTFIGDSLGNKLLSFNYVASPANYIEVKNAAAGNNPLISALGTDTNIGITLQSLGSGYVYCTNTSAGTPPFAFQMNGSSSLSFFRNVGLTANRTYTFPDFSGNVVVGNTAPITSGVLLVTSALIPTWSPAMTNGQLVIGSTGATPVVAALTGSTGLTVTNSAGGITLTNSAVPSPGAGVSVTPVGNTYVITPQPVTTTLSYNAGSVAWPLSSNPWIFSTYTAVTGNVTLSAASNGITGAAYTFVHIQAASGGPFTLSFNSNYKFPQGIVPTVTTTASAVDIFTFIWDGTFMRCVGISQNIS